MWAHLGNDCSQTGFRTQVGPATVLIRQHTEGARPMPTDPDTAAALDTLHGLFLAGGCTIEDYLAVRALLVEFSVDEIRDALGHDETPRRLCGGGAR
jgi:hypothetical protein